MNPTLNQLKIFATVAELKSMTKAAQKLYMTQPAISIQLQKLEEKYGIALFEMIGKSFHLTEAGSILLTACEDVQKSLDNVDMQLSQLKGSLKGRLKIVVVSTAKYFVPGLLGQFRNDYPEIDIRLKVTNRKTVIERLAQNQDDLTIMSQLPDQLSIEAFPFLQDALVLAASPTHPLAYKKKIAWKDLAYENFILRESGSGTRLVMEKLFQKHHIHPRIIMELGSSEAIKQAIMANIGLSIVSKMSLEHELALNKLVILDVNHLPFKHQWYAVHLKEKRLSPVAENFLKWLLK